MNINKQKGMTLIELMLAGLLGMIVAYFVMNIMATSSRTSMQSDGQAQAQENGRFIIGWLQAEARKAGYTPDFTLPRTQPFADICATGGPTPPANGANCTFETSTASSDRLAIRRMYSAATPSLKASSDCTGADLGAAGVAEGDVVIDVYWVEQNYSSGSSANDDNYDDVLRCVTYSEAGAPLNSSQVIASGIEGLQVLYGQYSVADPDGTPNVSRYVPADQVTDWNNVLAVRIAILTRSFTQDVVQNATRSYILLDATPYTFTDRTARHIQSTTVFLPNE